MSKESMKRFQRAVARCGLRTFAWCLKWLPPSGVQPFAKFLFFIAYGLIGKKKDISRESLKIAFGETKTEEEIENIVKRSFQNLALGMIETLYYVYHPEKMDNVFSFEGKEHLDNALKQDKGAIVVTAHFGIFPLMMLYCAIKGYSCSTIIRPARDEKLEQYLLRKRTKLGLKTIYAVPRKQCVSHSIKTLRKKEILFILMDQNFGSSGGVFVDFFGQKAATAPGPYIFGKRTGAPIVPMFVVRDGDHSRHKIIIEKPIELVEKETDEESLIYNIGVIANLIEKYIRTYPHEWGWMHRRWKSKQANAEATRTGV